MLLCPAARTPAKGTCTDDAAPLERSFTVLNSRGLEIRNHGEILPYFTFQTILRELLPKNGIGLANGFQTIPCDCTRAANAQTRSRERLTVVHLVRQTQLISHHANLVLEQNPNRLTLSKETVVHVHACQLLADCLNQQRCNDG